MDERLAGVLKTLGIYTDELYQEVDAAISEVGTVPGKKFKCKHALRLLDFYEDILEAIGFKPEELRSQLKREGVDWLAELFANDISVTLPNVTKDKVLSFMFELYIYKVHAN